MKDVLHAINWKVIGIAQIAGVAGEFINPIATQKVMLIAVLLTYVLDWVTGIAASIKAGRPFSSSRMRESIPKMVAYFAAITMAVIATAALKSGDIPVPQEWAGLVVTGVLTLIFAVEFTSVWENIFEIVPQLKRGFIAKLFDGVNDFINQNDQTVSVTTETTTTVTLPHEQGQHQ